MRGLLSRAAGPFFVGAGALHFIIPRAYIAIMPDRLPAHRELVYASGVAEAVGGIGLMVPDPRVRRGAMWLLLATLTAVFPANIHMAQHPGRYRVPGGRAALLARLPLQPVFALWVVRAARRQG
jgi:uncharacterized membrane protein